MDGANGIDIDGRNIRVAFASEKPQGAFKSSVSTAAAFATCCFALLTHAFQAVAAVAATVAAVAAVAATAAAAVTVVMAAAAAAMAVGVIAAATTVTVREICVTMLYHFAPFISRHFFHSPDQQVATPDVAAVATAAAAAVTVVAAIVINEVHAVTSASSRCPMFPGALLSPFRLR